MCTRLGALDFDDAVAACCVALEAGWSSMNQARRVPQIVERFGSFARLGFGIDDLIDVSPMVAERFTAAPTADSAARSASLQHLQRIIARLHGTADDTARRFNRTENIRPIPPSDPDFKPLYRRRNDAESINRALDETLWLRRAHSIGHERQHLNLITHALCANSLALHVRHRGDPPINAHAA